MKKLLRFYLPIFTILFTFGLLLFVYAFIAHPVLFAYAVGGARMHRGALNAVVKVNDRKELAARVFKLENDPLLVFVPDEGGVLTTVILDQSRNEVGLTFDERQSYELVFDEYLFQSADAGQVICRTGATWDYNPNLDVPDSRISFNTRPGEYGRPVRVEILFEGA